MARNVVADTAAKTHPRWPSAASIIIKRTKTGLRPIGRGEAGAAPVSILVRYTPSRIQS